MDATWTPQNIEFEAAIRRAFVRQGLMGTIGAFLTTVEPGRVIIELPFSQRISQQQGLFHGGVIGALADTASGFSALTLLPEGSEVLTVEYKINFMRPAAGSRLRAEGSVVRNGRTLSVVRAEVQVEDGGAMATCALLQATMMRVDPRK